MQEHIHTLVHSFFGKEKLDEVPVETLQRFVQKYPFSPAGHLLLSFRLGSAQTEEQEQALQRTALYFNNPAWLDCVIREMGRFPETRVPSLMEKSQVSLPEIPQAIEAESNSSGPETIYPQKTESQELEPAGENTPEDGISGDRESDVLKENTGQEPYKLTNLPPAEEKELLFEPYHTIDYFASQGIRLKPEDFDRDKFGKQLKSFTDWLRTMKKISPQLPENDEENYPDENIRYIASHSIEGNEIETESMAEVWARQGNREKAIEIYRKLSLQNPSKNHYFAAKIDQINRSL